MSALYELWASAELAAALGAQVATLRDSGRAHDGRSGVFAGAGVRVEYNAARAFRGVGGAARFSARPDVVALLGDGALIADVKYRALHALGDADAREVNDQLLRYMGAHHARLGLALWPAPRGAPLDLDVLGDGRAFLGKLRVHPADSPEVLRSRLRAALARAGLPDPSHLPDVAERNA